MSVTFIERLARIPHYSAGAESAEAARGGGDRRDAGVQRVAVPAGRGSRRGGRSAAGEVNRYPDRAPARCGARSRTATSTRCPGIAVGNGSCEILLAAAEALLEPWNEIVYAWPSFSMYPHLDAVTDAKEVTVPLADGYVHDLDAMVAAVTEQTRLMIVCNPNNPTGTYLPSDAVGALLEGVPAHVLVILDEAYVEFQTVEDPDTSLDLLRRFDNLVILRTFSKAYGLAGLRVGFALGSEEFWPRSTGCASRSPSTTSRRRPRPRRCATRTTSHGARSGTRSSGCGWRRSWMSSVSTWPTARRTSAGCRSATATRSEVVARARAGRRRGAAGRGARRPRVSARQLRHARGERALHRGADPGDRLSAGAPPGRSPRRSPRSCRAARGGGCPRGSAGIPRTAGGRTGASPITAGVTFAGAGRRRRKRGIRGSGAGDRPGSDRW